MTSSFGCIERSRIIAVQLYMHSERQSRKNCYSKINSNVASGRHCNALFENIFYVLHAIKMFSLAITFGNGSTGRRQLPKLLIDKTGVKCAFGVFLEHYNPKMRVIYKSTGYWKQVHIEWGPFSNLLRSKLPSTFSEKRSKRNDKYVSLMISLME